MKAFIAIVWLFFTLIIAQQQNYNKIKANLTKIKLAFILNIRQLKQMGSPRPE